LVVGPGFTLESISEACAIPAGKGASLLTSRGVRITGEVDQGEFQNEGKLLVPGVGEYTGTLRNSRPHGVGSWTNTSATETYTGQWCDGQRDGEGRARFETGAKYTGQWSEDMMHGTGELQETTSVYSGQWVNGKRHGTGVLEELHMQLIQYDVVTEQGEVTSKQPRLEQIIESLEERVVHSERQLQILRDCDERSIRCSVCATAVVDKILKPCNHATVCGECANRLNGKCPVCRAQIRSIDKVMFC
jgi:hypothetical protein